MTILKKQKHEISLKEERSCYSCHQKFNFEEYKEIYSLLNHFDNSTENFLKMLDISNEFIVPTEKGMDKTWRDLKYKILCPKCQLDFKQANNLVRRCVKCGRKITFVECYSSSLNENFPRQQLFNYWNNPILQFYCCSCFKKARESIKKREGL